MKAELFKDEISGSEMYHAMLSTGMNAYFLPLSSDVKISMFHLFTKFGGIDARFRMPETRKVVEVENGTAHFLEHCAFYDPTGQHALIEFYKKGVAANAWTLFDHTTYHFSSAGTNTRKNLDFLVDFVTTPYLTDAVVAKEQGVIAQEIAMYHDDPNWVQEENLRQALFQEHPFRRSLGGDKSAIMRITKEYLQFAYGTFYHPSNLNFVVFAPSKNGMKDAVKYFMLMDNLCAKKGFSQKQAPDYIYTDEPVEVAQKKIVDWHKVPEPLISIGFKGNMSIKGSPYERMRTDVLNDLLAKALFSKSSEAVYKLAEAGVIRGGAFSGDYSSGRGFGMFSVGGSTDDCDRFTEGVISMIREQVRGKLPRELFETLKEAKISEAAKQKELEKPENLEGFIITSLAAGLNPMDAMKVLMDISYEDVLEAGKRYLDTDNYSVAIMNPKA